MYKEMYMLKYHKEIHFFPLNSNLLLKIFSHKRGNLSRKVKRDSCIYFKVDSLYFTNSVSMSESRKCRRKGWSRHMMVRWTKNSLTRRDSVAGPTVTSPSPLPLLLPFSLPSCPSSVLSVEKRGLDRSLSTRPPRKSPSGETTRWLCPLLRASGPLEFFVGLSQETPGRPLGLPPSLSPRGHPKGILDLASIARREDSVDTITVVFLLL